MHVIQTNINVFATRLPGTGRDIFLYCKTFLSEEKRTKRATSSAIISTNLSLQESAAAVKSAEFIFFNIPRNSQFSPQNREKSRFGGNASTRLISMHSAVSCRYFVAFKVEGVFFVTVLSLSCIFDH